MKKIIWGLFGFGVLFCFFAFYLQYQYFFLIAALLLPLPILLLKKRSDKISQAVKKNDLTGIDFK